MSTDVRLREERVSWRTAAIAFGVAIAGAVVLYVTSVEQLWTIHPRLQRVVEKIGDLLFVTGLLSVLWELFGRRAFLDEILAKTGVAREIRAAGIRQILRSFRDGIDWERLFANARELDIFVSYGRTWRNQHLDQLRQLALKPHARIRLVLPDPRFEPNLAALAQRYATEAANVRERIEEAIKVFSEMQGGVEIWLTTTPPVYSLYRFDDVAVFSIYNHQVDRSPVPAFILERGGTLFDFAVGDLEKLLADRTRCSRVFPPP